MKRTDADEHSSNLFQDENLPTTAGTLIEETWLNAVQEELANTIEHVDITLSGANDEQLIEAIYALVSIRVRRHAAMNYREVAAGLGSVTGMFGIASPQGDDNPSRTVVITGDGGKIIKRDKNDSSWQTMTSGTTADLLEVDYDEVADVYGAVGNDTGVPETRKGVSDGVTWSAGLSTNTNLPDVARAIAKANGYAGARTWIIVGYDGVDGEYAELTTDMTTTSVVYKPSNLNGKKLEAVATKNDGSGFVVMVGEAGTIATKTLMDSAVVIRTSGTSEDLKAVGWSDRQQLWFVVGDNGTVLASSDGITWNTSPNPEAGVDWKDVATDGDVIVISGGITTNHRIYVGDAGSLYYRKIVLDTPGYVKVRFVNDTQHMCVDISNGDVFESEQA